LTPGFHFHDLRHTGNSLAASAGASTRELMHRMGHSSMRAALIYQHATSERDREIAAEIDRRIAAQRKRSRGKRASDGPGDGPDEGTAGVPAHRDGPRRINPIKRNAPVAGVGL
jgi:hypothetical protein